jgi:hypothetical protein
MSPKRKPSKKPVHRGLTDLIKENPEKSPSEIARLLGDPSHAKAISFIKGRLRRQGVDLPRIGPHTRLDANMQPVSLAAKMDKYMQAHPQATAPMIAKAFGIHVDSVYVMRKRRIEKAKRYEALLRQG